MGGRPFLVIPYKSYEEDKQDLPLLRKQARQDFESVLETCKGYMREMDTPEKREMLMQMTRASRAPEETRRELKRGLGNWIADYLVYVTILNMISFSDAKQFLVLYKSCHEYILISFHFIPISPRFL